MSKLKLKFKKDSKETNKEVKQELKKDNPFNLIDLYFSLTQRFFKCENIKLRKDQDV